MMAIAYGNVYVAQIAMGANNEQALVAMREAEAYRGTVADPGLLAVHRARHRHAPRHEAGGARRGLRLLAAVPLRSDHARARHEPVPARLAAAAHSARGIPLQRGALQVAGADAPRRRETDAGRRRSAASLERYRVYEDLATRDGSRFDRGMSRHEPQPHAISACSSRTRSWRRASPLTATLDGMRRLEDAGAAAVVMASLYEEQIRAEDTAYAMYTEHGSNSQAEASTLLSRAPRLRQRRLWTSRDAAACGRGARHPGDREPERHDLRGMDRARAPVSSRRAPRRSS